MTHLKRLAALFTLVLMALPAYGQGVTTASMRGVVSDATGETLPGANVLAVHTPSGSEYGTSTNTQGTFNLRGMRVGGPYTVTVSFVGFETFTREGIFLSLGESFTLNAELGEDAVQLGEVEVVADGGIFDQSRTGTGTNVDETAIRNMASVGRDLADFTRMTPQAYVENDDDDGPAISRARTTATTPSTSMARSTTTSSGSRPRARTAARRAPHPSPSMPSKSSRSRSRRST